MVKSFILTPDYFKSPESHQVVRESGVEDRYKRAFSETDSHFSLCKDDYSDGLIRYTVDNEVLFYGIQECKLNKSSDSYYSRIVQALAYVCAWTKLYPGTLHKFKVLILPTEQKIDVVYIETLLKSTFWSEFCFYYSEHTSMKGHSASNFYKLNQDVRALLLDYLDRIPTSHYEIGEELDLKIVTEEILENCL